jgi:serine/threonine-protein kinase
MDIDHRADIYSLGATMYHIVTGKPPFEADTPAAVMHKHLKSPLVPADHVNTALSAGVGEIIEVAMAKKREDRYNSMEEMLADLKSVRMGQLPLHAKRMVDMSELEQLEKTGKTIDIAPPAPPPPPVWQTPIFLLVACLGGLSLLINLVVIILWAMHAK